MKKLFTLLIMVISFITNSFAQDAIYIYRNDGDFNAFFKNEIDSITYSHLDLDSVYNADFKTQVIYTNDSIYRIPLEVVDSVSFFAPPAILNKDVFLLTAAHDTYLSDADTVSFTLSLNTPVDMIPAEGNIVVSEYDCMSFPDGIIGRITYATKDDSGYHFDCEKVGIDAVYDQILIHKVCQPDNQQSMAYNKSSIYIPTTIIWDMPFYRTLEKDGTKTELNIRDLAAVTVTVRKELGQPFYFNLVLENSLRTNFTFNAESSVNISDDIDIIPKLTVPLRLSIVPGLWITPKLNLKGYFEEKGKISLDFEASYNRYDKIRYTYLNQEWETKYSVREEGPQIDVAQLSMDGYAEVGIIPGILLAFNGTATGIGMNYKIGVREEVHFEFDAIKYFDSGAYDAIKDSYARTYIPQEMTVYAQYGLFENKTSPQLGPITIFDTIPQIGNDKYLLPTFSKISYQYIGEDESSVALYTEPSRDLLFPVNIGFALYDDKDKLIGTKYSQVEYQNLNEWALKGLQQQFTNIEKGKIYTAYPIVKILGKELVASPLKTFGQIDTCNIDFTVEYPKRTESSLDEVRCAVALCPIFEDEKQRQGIIDYYAVLYKDGEEVFKGTNYNISGRRFINKFFKRNELLIDYENYRAIPKEGRWQATLFFVKRMTTEIQLH